MDPTKQLGIGKEQARIEHEARRNFQKKWSKLADEKLNKLYNQNEIDKQLKNMQTKQDLCPYVYTGKGDSYFLSPDMYDSMLAKCRCGRKRSETHILKCLQKAENPFSQTKIDAAENSGPQRVQSARNEVETARSSSKKPTDVVTYPKTSNSLIGWQKRPSNYKQWENSMRHISPIATMTQPRLTATSFHVLHIA